MGLSDEHFSEESQQKSTKVVSYSFLLSLPALRQALEIARSIDDIKIESTALGPAASGVMLNAGLPVFSWLPNGISVKPDRFLGRACDSRFVSRVLPSELVLFSALFEPKRGCWA